MRRLIWVPLVALAACHAHTTAGNRGAQKEAPPAEKQVSSPRPVRTTPNAMLDDKSMREIQKALAAHGVSVEQTGKMDAQTEQALRTFQGREHTAKTGLPDYDTLRHLGLNPKSIYIGGTERKTEQKQGTNQAKR